MHFILALQGFGSLQTYLTIDRPKCVRQWLNGDGRRSRSRSRNRDHRAGPPGACDNSIRAGGRRSREGSPARGDLLSGRDHLPQSRGPHPRWPSQSRGGGGQDRPCEASWRERGCRSVDLRHPGDDGGSGVRCDGGLPHRRDNTRDLGSDRFRSEDRRPPARSHAHRADRGGDRAGGSGGGCYGGDFYRGGGGGGGGGYVGGRRGGGGGGGYEREGSGAVFTLCWQTVLSVTPRFRVYTVSRNRFAQTWVQARTHIKITGRKRLTEIDREERVRISLWAAF